MSRIMLHVSEENPISLHVEEGRQKPAQSKTATPTYEKQIIVPDEGYVLSKVEIDPIPDPTDELHISENGQYNVSRYGSAKVEVPQGVFPEGTIVLTNDGTFDVTQYETAIVNTLPVKGVFFSDYDDDGYPHAVATRSLSSLPAWYFWNWGASTFNRTLVTCRLSAVFLNDGITIIASSALRSMNRVTTIHFPSTLTRIESYNFYDDTMLSKLDFSRCTRIPTFDKLGNDIPSGCVLSVPAALFSEWITSPGWADLADVVWESV